MATKEKTAKKPTAKTTEPEKRAEPRQKNARRRHDDKPAKKETAGRKLMGMLEAAGRLKTESRTCLAYIGGSGRSVSQDDLAGLLEWAYRQGASGVVITSD